jgi:hypothetical protein
MNAVPYSAPPVASADAGASMPISVMVSPGASAQAPLISSLISIRSARGALARLPGYPARGQGDNTMSGDGAA